MADSKRKKEVKQKEVPKGKIIAQGGDPERYYSENPAWTFANADQEMWAFSRDHIGTVIWSEILPRLQAFETQTWGEILVRNKKQNHSLDLNELNKVAQDVNAALQRARSTASPINAARFDIQTPCHVDGTCHNCNSPQSICNYVHFLRNSPNGRHVVVLVGENLGY